MEPDAEPIESAEEEGISLRGLTEAFARAMGQEAPPPYEPSVEPAAEAVPVESDEAEPEPAPLADDACPVTPGSIFEAMLFVGNRENQPISAEKAAELMRGVRAEEIPDIAADLNRRYEAEGCPYSIVEEPAGYRLTLRKEYHALRDRFLGRVREAKLSQAAIDVLAIVAYQQPIAAAEIGKLRGKSVKHLLAQLARRGLVKSVRPDGADGIVQYCTSDRFLAVFGLESLSDLPQGEDMDRA